MQAAGGRKEAFLHSTETAWSCYPHSATQDQPAGQVYVTS
jgi:hypothetical protein